MTRIEAEWMMLSCIKDEPELIDEMAIDAEIFAHDKTRKTFEAMLDLRREKVKVMDDIVLSHAALKHGVTMSDLTNISVVVGNPAYYHDLILGNEIKKRALKLSETIRAKKDTDTEEIVEDIERWVSLLRGTGRPIVELRNVMTGVIETIERRYKGEEPGGIMTGFSRVDEFTLGFHPGELIIIAARTSIGKTTVALNMALNMAAAGKRVGFFSCEMPIQAIAERILATESGVDLHRLRSGHMTATDFPKFINGASKIVNMNIIMDDTSYIKVAELKSKARRMKRQGVDIIFVDYLTLINYEDARIPRHERVGIIAKILKELSSELAVPIVAMSQLNREADGKRPSLADIRQSGEIEEDANIIIMLWKGKEDDVIHAAVGKNRNGPTGEFNIMFDRNTMRMTDCNF